MKNEGSYWSSTPYDGGRAWFVRLIDAQWRYDYMDYSWDNNLIERINRYVSLSRKNVSIR
ncbi:MAG: hypothetical protein IJ107_02695 [Lachnospiraceae bacterium]|nr:hypothetical protein [Lachnospiraceae bacterium]